MTSSSSARAGGARRGNSPEAARRAEPARGQRVRAGKRLGGGGAHPVGRGDGPAFVERTHPGLAAARRPAQRAGQRGPLSVSYRGRILEDPGLHAPCVLQKPRHVRGQPRQRVPLAGQAGRGARRGDLPRLRGRGSAAPRRRRGARRRHRRHGHRARRKTGRQSSTGHGAACALYVFRRRLPRPSRQAASGPLQPARRR